MTAREALDVYQGSALVRYPGPQLKADQAMRVLSASLTLHEINTLRSTRGCFLDNVGHLSSEFNDACDAVRARFDREEKL